MLSTWFIGVLFTTRVLKGEHCSQQSLIRLLKYLLSRSSVDVVSKDIPAEMLDLAKAKRTELVEQLAEVDEEIGDLILADEQPTNAQLADAIRRATISLKFSPVFLGSAIKNTGVQPLLDGVCAYLPNPAQSEVLAHDTSKPANSPQVPLTPAASAPLVSLAFKLEEGRFGQLTYMRVYQGSLRKGQTIFNARTGKKVKLSRLARMHSNEMEDIESIGPGEICAMFGVECSTGDTFTDGSTSYSMVSCHCFSSLEVVLTYFLLDFHVRSGACHLSGYQVERH